MPFYGSRRNNSFEWIARSPAEGLFLDHVHPSIEANRMTDLYYHLGLVLSHLGQEARAERTYRKALELQPDDANALNNLGILLARRDDLEGAMGLFERALSAEPGHVDAAANLGRVRGLLDR